MRLLLPKFWNKLCGKRGIPIGDWPSAMHFSIRWQDSQGVNISPGAG